jgi:ADP-ribose pyrophosphatase YjhB (NUDIX family)
MYIRIYFGDKPLFLCNEIDHAIQPYVTHDDAVFIDELNTHTVKSMIHEMEQQQVHAGVFFHTDFDELKKAFFKKFTLITAAGGLVKSEKEDILMIFRRGKWDLPKGKIDKNEKAEPCAVREVKEETGLKEMKLEQLLLTTYHTYHEGTKHLLKETKWFAMNGSSQQTLTPQTEEDITDIKWVNQKNMDSYLQKAYPIIRDVVQAAEEKEFITS